MPTLTAFSPQRPRWEHPQAHLLAWLTEAHASAGGDVARALARCACKPDVIASRGVSVDLARDGGDLYDLRHGPRGAGTAARMERYAGLAAAAFERAYADDDAPPRDLLHVTCTGYASPSAAQRLVAARGWGAHARVTHAYHMGCYAALPALRLAAALVESTGARADLVHTELCSLHLDPSDHRLDQLVVQSLFADGIIRYALVPDAAGAPGLRLIAQHEVVVPDTAGAMTWTIGDHGMAMTLGREVPARIAGGLRGFVGELLARAGLPVAALAGAHFAIHPGGPRILDAVRDTLELDEAQLTASRAVLRAYGNMSSATLPHVWMRLAADPAVPRGARVVTFAFGPGLTMCGALLEKT